MYDSLPTHPEDKILRIMQLYRDDPREKKIDLGVGVYKNAAGLTPIMQSIKAAEKRLWETEETKSYVGLLGAPDFSDAMAGLVLGNAVARENIACAATPGGTGAVRQAFELVAMVNPQARIWVSDPSWGNHVSILNYLGIPNSAYRYFEFSTGELDFEGMVEDLNSAKSGDVVLLHGCCHNPTGVNLTKQQWQKVSDLLISKGLVPMIDIAYQGFGNGLDEDAFGVRLIASTCPETLIAASCSKNFGVYRERTGIFMGVGQDKAKVALLQANMAYLNRQNYSFPPDHGARLVTMVLNDPKLRADWEAELEEVRSGMLDLRQQLAAELQRQTNSDRFGFITEHNGMFSMLGLTEEQVDKLREDHAVYAVGDSRINIAGLSRDTVPVLAKAIASVI